MRMLSAAAVLLMTMIGPTILTTVCDLRCMRHEHHAPHVATSQSCHEERPSTNGPAMTSGTAGDCHEQAQTFTTIAADSRRLNAAPAVVQLPSALVVDRLQLPVVTRNTSVGPPGLVLQTTLLRI